MKKELNWRNFFLSLRIVTALWIALYGVAKIWQFDGAIDRLTECEYTSDMQIMWAFFGTTLVYPLVIGAIQIFGSILIIFERTMLAGALILTPLFLNIILLDILYSVTIGALINAILYQFVLLVILYNERSKLRFLLKKLVEPVKKGSGNITYRSLVVLFSVLILIVLYVIFMQLMIKIIHS